MKLEEINENEFVIPREEFDLNKMVKFKKARLFT